VKHVAALLCLLVFVDSFGYAIVVPLLPFAARDFGAPELAIGSLFGSYSLCQLMAAPVLGMLSDRHGRRPLLLLSQLGTAVGFALMAGAWGFWPLLVSRVVDGVTAGNISIINAAVLDNYPRAAWGRYFAYLSTATGLGFVLGLIVSSLLAPYGLAAAATVALGFSLVAILLTCRVFPDTDTHRPIIRPGRVWRYLAQGAGGAASLRAIAGKLLATIAQTAFILALPLFLFHQLGFREQQAAVLLIGLLAVAAAFQLAVVPRLIARLSETGAATAGFGLLIVGGLATALAADLRAILISSTLVMWGTVLLGPALTALLANTNRMLDEGMIMGIDQSVASAGQMLGPLLGYGALTLFNAVGYGLLCAALAVLGVVA
jgi:DHA1 family tetracycline resistance protein-like MFS transporter